jgi:ATP-binding cassette subfamily B protein IrtB
MNAIKNITIGHTERLYKPVGYTMLANLVNIVPFCLSIEAIRIIFNAFDGSGQPLDTPRLWWIFGIMAVYMLVMALAERASYRANFRGAYEMSASGRLSLAEHLRKLSLGFLSRRDPGDLSSMLITDFMMAETGISHHLPQLMGAVVMPVLAFASLVWIDWRMAVSMFAALPLALLVLWASTKAQRSLSGRQIQAKINAGNRLEEYLQGIRVMKAYNLLGDRFVRLRDAFAELRRACIRQEALLGPFVLLSITLVRAGLTLMVLCGTYLLLGGKLSILVFVLFLVVGSRVFDPLTSALTNFTEFRYFSIAGGRILSLMNEPEMKGERQSPATGDIRFEHVSFAYQDKEVLHNITVTLPKNSLTALVGPSGSGKSTVMKLCARFYDPQQGRIFFGGVPMDEIAPESLMSHISMVFQDVYLFQDTIRNNIRFGKTDATDEEIIAAAKKACCHDFIMRLPQGYDTMVGEGGCTLSGGEKQRISIARAILKDAPVILLDEATASLDPENEVEVQKAIDSLIKGRTVIAIAHRLKTIKDADRIIVLEDGRIKEEGTHDELIQKKGLYAHLWDIQENTSGWKLQNNTQTEQSVR